MKKIYICIFVFITILSVPAGVFALEDSDMQVDEEAEYNEALQEYDLSFMDELDSESYDLLDSLGLADFDYNTIINFSVSDAAGQIFNMIKESAVEPLKSCAVIILIIILSSLFQSFRETVNDSGTASLLSTVSSVVIALILISKVKTVISMSCSAISVCADFVFAFIPAFCIIVATSGNTITAFSTNTLLLSLSQALNFISKNVWRIVK